MTFAALAQRLNGSGGPVVGRATVNPGGVGNAFAMHIVDVEVDPDTGKVEILRYTALQDVGKAMHPSYVEGQMQGGAVQGIGWALNEEYYFDDDGRLLNSTFLDYRMPVSLDVPMIDTVIIEVANPGHPYGSARRGGGVHSAADGGDSERNQQRDRRADDGTADVAGEGGGGAGGEWGLTGANINEQDGEDRACAGSPSGRIGRNKASCPCIRYFSQVLM